MRYVKLVLKYLYQKNLYLKLQKYIFYKEKINFQASQEEKTEFILI